MTNVAKLLIGSAMFLTLAACLPQDTDTISGAPTDTGSCTPEAFAELIGQPASAAAVIPDPKRIIPDGSPVTLDHVPNRTNVDLDRAGLIVRITCG